MLLLELAQARLGKADARGEGGGEGGGDVGEQRLRGEREVPQASDAFFAGVGPDCVGVGVVFS